MKLTDNWKTPIWFKTVFSEAQNFTDPLPPNFITDFLKEEYPTQSLFINPPYSNPLPFVQKAIEQHGKYHNPIILLLKLDTTTKWWLALEQADAHFLYCRERLHYSEEGPSPFSSVLAILSD